MTTRKLIWGMDQGGTHVAKIARGSRYTVNDESHGGKPNWAAHRKTRSGYGSGYLVLGARATLAEAKALCEQHYAARA
jgi:hypothetical protein